MKKTLAKKTEGGRKEGVLHISTVKALNASSFLSDILMHIFLLLLPWCLWPTAQSLLVVDVVAMNDERNLASSSSFEQGKKSIVMIAKGDAAGK